MHLSLLHLLPLNLHKSSSSLCFDWLLRSLFYHPIIGYAHCKVPLIQAISMCSDLPEFLKIFLILLHTVGWENSMFVAPCQQPSLCQLSSFIPDDLSLNFDYLMRLVSLKARFFQTLRVVPRHILLQEYGFMLTF